MTDIAGDDAQLECLILENVEAGLRIPASQAGRQCPVQIQIRIWLEHDRENEILECGHIRGG